MVLWGATPAVIEEASKKYPRERNFVVGELVLYSSRPGIYHYGQLLRSITPEEDPKLREWIIRTHEDTTVQRPVHGDIGKLKIAHQFPKK